MEEEKDPILTDEEIGEDVEETVDEADVNDVETDEEL